MKIAACLRSMVPGGAGLVLALAAFAGCRTVETQAPSVAPTIEDMALAERAIEAARRAEGTPGQEMANMLMREWPYARVRRLKGEQPATAKELEDARAYVRDVTETILEKGPGWPVLEQVEIPFASEAPRIDGKVNEPVWQRAGIFRETFPFNQAEAVPRPANVWRVLWDETHLYFAFECADEDIVAPVMQRDEAVFNDDCVEMFILPEFRLGVYWEVVVSPSGSIFDGLQAKKFQGWGCLPGPEQDVAGLQIGYTVDGTLNHPGDVDRGYVVEVAVPFRELPTYTRGNKPQPGDTLHFMLVRIDRTRGEFQPYAFQPLLNWGHNVWNHARAVLVKQTQP
jgi:hypothetical protein